MAGVTLLMG